MIKQHMEVVELTSETDYRLRALERAEIYHSPLDDGADASLLATFKQLSPEAGEESVHLQIEGRTIHTRWRGDGVVWFDFPQICDGPRSQNDYIEVSRCYNTVLISNVPQMGLHNDDVTRRFISLVDEFYDRNVKLVLSAAVPMHDLYVGGNLSFEFERTCSRLQEMQSHDYLASVHLS
jgi:cell division protein ZapE